MSPAGPEPRVATQVWVQAQLRLCDRYFLQLVVTRRGDPDAGAVLVRLLRGEGLNLLLRRRSNLDGSTEWGVVPAGEAIDDEAADGYATREAVNDPDLWVIEIDDPEERYWPDAPLE